MAHRGVICYGCHQFRNNIKASVKNILNSQELEQEMLKAHTHLLKTGNVIEIKREKIIGWLCMKCSIKAHPVVKDRPFGMSWREAFRLKDNPKSIQIWKDQRLEMEIANNG